MCTDTYEVLVVEHDDYGDATYYIRYYNNGQEFKGLNLKLDQEDFDNFTENKREI